MTYDEAVKEIQELAGQDTWALEFEVASYHGPQIRVYIARAGVDHCEHAKTYRGAIDNAKFKINPSSGQIDKMPEFLEMQEAANP